MRISDWSSDVCSSDLLGGRRLLRFGSGCIVGSLAADRDRGGDGHSLAVSLAFGRCHGFVFIRRGGSLAAGRGGCLATGSKQANRKQKRNAPHGGTPIKQCQAATISPRCCQVTAKE